MTRSATAISVIAEVLGREPERQAAGERQRHGRIQYRPDERGIRDVRLRKRTCALPPRCPTATPFIRSIQYSTGPDWTCRTRRPYAGPSPWTHTFNLGGGALQSTHGCKASTTPDVITTTGKDRARSMNSRACTSIPTPRLTGNVSYRPVEADYHLGFYIRNLTDERVANSLGNTLANRGTLALNPPPNGDQRYLTGTLRPPRARSGVRIGYEF